MNILLYANNVVQRKVNCNNEIVDTPITNGNSSSGIA